MKYDSFYKIIQFSIFNYNKFIQKVRKIYLYLSNLLRLFRKNCRYKCRLSNYRQFKLSILTN